MRRFVSEQEGATAIEYALIAVMLSMAIFVGAAGIGQALIPTFQNASTHLS